MKNQLSALDVYFLIKEMGYLEGSKVDKIYQPNENEVLFQLHVRNKGRVILRIITGKLMFISLIKGRIGEPGGFCMYLRKHLEGTKLISINQIKSERIVKLEFARKENQVFVIIELFGKGNLIVTDSDLKIMNALVQQKWSDREIAKGQKYEYPKKEIGFLDLNSPRFVESIIKKEAVIELAKSVGLGGNYAEEILFELGIEKKKKLTIEESKKIAHVISQILDKKITAEIAYNGQEIVDITPYPFKIYENAERKTFDSLNEAYDEYFVSELQSKEEFKSKHQNAIDKTKKIVAAQEKQLRTLEKKADTESRSAELIYENYNTVKEVITEINKAMKKYSLQEIKNKLKGHETIKDVNPKEKSVTIEIID